MDNNCPANYLVDRKTISQKQREGKPVVPKQRRQISCVIRVSATVGIVMGHGVCKRIAHIAAASAAGDLGEDDYSRIGLIQPHAARYARIIFAARNAGCRLGPAAQNR